MALVVAEQIGFVEHQNHRHAIRLSRSQKTVDKRCRRLRMRHRDDEESLIEVGGKNMTLLREVLRLAYDIVTPVVNGRDKSRSFQVTG